AVQAPTLAAGEGPAVLNVIGRQFLSQYFVVVDYAGASITLWPPDTENSPSVNCGQIRIRMKPTQEERLPVSDFDSLSGRMHLVWDTGATYSILSEALAEKLKLATTTRGPDSPKFYRSETLSALGQNLGPVEFVVLPLNIPTKDFEGMLGG